MSADQHTGATQTDPPDAGTPQGPPRQEPPQVHMPLLDYITSTSLDADYAHVAERSGGTGRTRKVKPGVTGLAVLIAFGLLVATAAVQTARNAGAASTGRASLVSQIKARTVQVNARRARITNLRDENQSLQNLFLETTTQGRALSARLNRLGVLSGSLPVTGPGVKVVVDDAPGAVSDAERVLDKDLQKLVNALWASGAEAISINGQRLTNLSAIRFAGAAITVNFVSLSRPYTVLAVGNPDTMPARFVETEHGRDWLDLRAVNHLQFTMTSEESLRLPAAPARRLDLRYATEGEKR